MSKKSNRFSPEVRERAVRMVQEHRCEYLTGNASAPHRGGALTSQHPIVSGYTIFAGVPYIVVKLRSSFGS